MWSLHLSLQREGWAVLDKLCKKGNGVKGEYMHLNNSTNAFIIYFSCHPFLMPCQTSAYQRLQGGGMTSLCSALKSWLCNLFRNVIIYSPGFFFKPGKLKGTWGCNEFHVQKAQLCNSGQWTSLVPAGNWLGQLSGWSSCPRKRALSGVNCLSPWAKKGDPQMPQIAIHSTTRWTKYVWSKSHLALGRMI